MNNNNLNNNDNINIFQNSLKNKILFPLKNSKEDLSFNIIKSRKNTQTLVLSNSGLINNKLFNSENSLNNEINLRTDYTNYENRIKSAERDIFFKTEENYILSRNNKIKDSSNNISFKKNINELTDDNEEIESKKYSDFFENSNTNFDIFLLPNSSRNNTDNTKKQSVSDFINMKENCDNLEKLNTELNLLNKNLITENNDLKLKICSDQIRYCHFRLIFFFGIIL